MRVLQVINSLATGGAEKLILESAPRYKEKGITMEVLLLNGRSQPFAEKLMANGVVVHSLSNGSVYNPFLSFKIMGYLKKFDLVHVHLFPSLYWVALAKALSFSKTKLVFTEHNTTNRRRGWLFRLTDRWAYKRYSRIVIITEEVGDMLRRHLGASEEKFVLINNGIDVKKFREAKPADRSQFKIDQNAKVIVQVSSFTEQKDQATLIRALPKLKSDTAILLVGTGPLMDDCRKTAEELGVSERVEFLGTRMDVPELLKMADAVVLSSHFEGLSLSSIEGLASGRPFIASRVPGLTQVVEGAGILFPESDEDALATALNQLFNDDQYYQEISEKGSQRADQYDIDRMIDKHCTLYRELCRNQS